MIVWPLKYNYQVCPFCKSKGIAPIGLVRMAKDIHIVELQQVNRTGYLCDNCKRYHPIHLTKHIIDRAEMRRDVKRLMKFLEEGE